MAIMRWLLVACVAIGCTASGGGDPGKTTVDAAVADSESGTSGDGSIFGTEDTDSTDTEVDDTGMAADTSAPMDSAPACGAPTQPCCGTSCSVGYCYSGTCYAPPEVIEETSDPGLCANLAVTHASPSFFMRFTIHGRPGALAYRYAKKISCTGAVAMVTPESPLTLKSDGSYVFTIENTADTSCSNANIGKFEAWIVVDGVETAHHEVSVYNSGCTTCAAAATLCP
jgi:hypothetical protein